MKDKQYNYPYGFGMFAAKTRNFDLELRKLAREKGVELSREVLELVEEAANSLVNEVEVASIDHAVKFGR